MSELIEVDGSYQEAGGQIIRTAIGLSALAGKPCRIFNIRKGRPKPGLMAQHLTGVRAVAELCGAKVEGAELWSTELAFNPCKIKSGDFSFDVGTAGSISLVLQSLTIPAIAAPGPLSFKISGGTDVSWSPSTTYFQHIFCNWLSRMGVAIHMETEKYGFYPKGGGKIKVEIMPSVPKPILAIERGILEGIDGLSIASADLTKAKVAERQIDGARRILQDLEAEPLYIESLSPGSAIHLHAHFSNCKLGASSIGARGKPAEKVGEEAATLLKAQIDSSACADRWMADQLLPFMAIATEKGPSEISVAEITNHCLTNIWVIEKFLPVKFEIKGENGKPGTITCRKL